MTEQVDLEAFEAMLEELRRACPDEETFDLAATHLIYLLASGAIDSENAS